MIGSVLFLVRMTALTAAAVLIYLAFSSLIQVKRKWWWRGILLFACGISSMMIIYVADPVNFPASMVIFLLSVWFGCEGSGLKRITLGLMFVSTISAFNCFFDYSIGYLLYVNEIREIWGGWYFLGRISFALVLFLSIRSRKWERDFELSPSLWQLMLLLHSGPLGIMMALIAFTSPYHNVSADILSDTILILVVMFSFGGLMKALSVLEKHQRLERESVLALYNQNYYASLEEQQLEIRRLRHDLANHLQVLLALPDQEKNSYIEGMLDNPAFVRVLNYCGDKTVNAVLSAKEGMMRMRGIRFYIKADIPGELPFEKADLCAVLANALDNAAEGCMKVKGKEKEVSLEARAGKGLLAVSVTNSFSAEAFPGQEGKREGWLIKTTKRDTVNHGFGLRSIREVVRKYGGNMEIRQEGERFILFFYLSMPE